MEEVKLTPPIFGPSGAKVIAYSWIYNWEELLNEQQEVVQKRVSDWSQSEINTESGRAIVHKFIVEMPDGNLKTTSAEGAMILLGFLKKDSENIKKFKSFSASAKVLAKLKLELAILLSKQENAFSASKEIIDQGYPEVVIVPDASWSQFAAKIFMGSDAWIVEDDYFKNNQIPLERMELLKESYLKKQLENKYNLKLPKYYDYYITKLQSQIDLQLKKMNVKF